MTDQHPITPPPELLVQQWLGEYFGCDVKGEVSIPELHLATRAAQWGADQELEACCEVLNEHNPSMYWGEILCSRRRPKPPSLKEQALVALHAIAVGANDMREQNQDLDTIRRALEQLDV